ncbi:hypothetical protein L2W58_06640 [Dethiosulfovibrio sp. F2B]|uniref:AfsR/SARP family transcriptional regulator n=1 Tax=Dethiosulfovibrio faecalis TaxID=2720018 RepID=UPI001F35B0CC|nr:BTAD domain-containing putative transcriptional regulator [Dethiosulfovibrio faecalis]MCF4151476.1 hypothetical protein [Dethiosulfovibrio faecalis]
MIFIRLFGSPSITRDGTPLTFPFKKVEALAYLLTSPGRHDRRRLANLLWPDKDEDRSLKNLRNALYRLRATLQEKAVLSKESRIFLSPDTVKTEQEFMENLSSLPERDLRRMGQPFLDGFSLDDGEDFNRWTQERRDALRKRYLDEVTSEARKAGDRGDEARATSLLQNALSAAPWDEEIARELMKALKRRGNLPKVVATYTELSKTLRDEMGLDPSPATVDLYRSIFRTMDVPSEETDERYHVELPRSDRDLLETLSVFGTATPLEDLEICSNRNGKSLEESALSLEEKGLISLSQPSNKGALALRINSGQLELSLYESISPFKRALIHRNILNLRDPGSVWAFSPPQDCRDLIRHSDNGGSLEDRISTRIRYLRLLSIGLCQGYPPIVDPVLIKLEEDGVSHSDIDDLTISIRDLLGRLETGYGGDRIPQQRRMFTCLSGFHSVWKGLIDQGKAELELALEKSVEAGDHETASEALCGLCLMAIRLSDRRAIGDYSDRLTREGKDNPLTRALCYRLQGENANGNDPQKAIDIMERAMAEIENLRASGFGYTAMEAMVWGGMSAMAMETGEFGESERCLRKGLSRLIGGGIRHGRWIFHSALAYIAWKKSDVKSMSDEAAKARESVDDVIYGDLGILYNGMQALAAAAGGQSREEVNSHIGRARFSASWLNGENRTVRFLQEMEKELKS